MSDNPNEAPESDRPIPERVGASEAARSHKRLLKRRETERAIKESIEKPPAAPNSDDLIH